jgi:hypothetical protein
VKWERGRSEGLKAMFQKESYLSSDFEFLKQHKSRINIVLSDEYIQGMQYKDKDYSIFEVYKKLQSLGLLDENNTKRLLDYEEAIKS